MATDKRHDTKAEILARLTPRPDHRDALIKARRLARATMVRTTFVPQVRKS